MNNKLNKIVSLFVVFMLAYTQIGCQSEEKKVNDSVVKEYTADESLVDNEQKTQKSELHFINTGNSDAILIIQDKKAALIDGGDNDDENLVVNYIKKQGITELEYVFATHPHADHIGGLDAVAREIKINNLYVSNGDAQTKTYKDFIQEASSKNLNPSVPLLNSEFKLGTSTFKVLSVANTNDPNNNSIVLLYTNGNDKVLLMGDAEYETEEKINPGDIDLLKVGHHGSHSSTRSNFIEKINPEYAVILASQDNKYGHPHMETMQLLESKNIEVHRSDECGDIIFISTGDGLEINCKIGTYNPGANSKKSKPKYEENIVKPNTVISSTENENIQPNTSVVYWSQSGKKYHSSAGCSGMKNPTSGTIDESNRTACSKCY